MLHRPEGARLVLHNESQPGHEDEPLSPTLTKDCPKGSLADRAVAAGTGEFSWGTQAALAPFLMDENAGVGKATAGGEQEFVAGVSALSLPGDSSSDTLGEEEDEHDALSLADLDAAALGDDVIGGEQLREVVAAGGYSTSYGRLVRGTSAGASAFEKVLLVPSVPSILPNPDLLLQQERARPSVMGYPYVPVPAAITRSFGEDNYSMIDRRAWLEVEDPKHRYAKNLRMYYKEWDKRGQPTASFWEWLEKDPVEVSQEYA